MADTDWHKFLIHTNDRLDSLRNAMPGVARGFETLAKNANAPGALDGKTKELIALAIGIAARCDGCLVYHAKAAAKAGASRQEIIETVGVAIYMGGGPSMIYGAEALEAFDQLTE